MRDAPSLGTDKLVLSRLGAYRPTRKSLLKKGTLNELTAPLKLAQLAPLFYAYR